MEQSSHHKENLSIRTFFDERAANWYKMVCPEHAERLRGMVASLGIPKGSCVLDVGAGNGVLLPFLLAEARFVVELDLSSLMLMEAKSCNAEEEASFLQADVLNLPIRSSTFDIIICNSCFPHFCDQRRAVEEMTRCLAVGGRLVVCHTQSRECINEHHRKVGSIVGGHELPTDDEMRTLMLDAGLTLLELTNTPVGYRLISIRND